MARRAARDAPPTVIERVTPLGPVIALVLGFVLLAVVGVVTVVVPELTDDGASEGETGAAEGGAAAPGAPAESAPPPPAP